MCESYVPYEVLRKLPYEYRIPVNYEDEYDTLIEENKRFSWDYSKGHSLFDDCELNE
jgi:hypothetical protein